MTTFRQTASGDEIFLDHIAHWVPDMGPAGDALETLGFTLTPYTEHTNSTAPGEAYNLPLGSCSGSEGEPACSSFQRIFW